FCATCDGPFFKGKDVCVFGGGDSAVEEALFLTNFVRKVTIIHRRDQLRAGAILQQRARANPKIDFIWDTVITGVNGKGKVESINIKNVKTNQEKEMPTAALFVFIGFDPNSKFVNGLVKLDESGYIITDIEMKTSLAGVLAAGDIRSKALRQIITACGDGAQAYGSAQHYLNSKPH
ncbi:MAG: FAD-dependent oxidoreductase, partial [Planctomycetes bacterium]|nr:FAD-dependent oxidoreductase [Planctomycetota bacterium]